MSIWIVNGAIIVFWFLLSDLASKFLEKFIFRNKFSNALIWYSIGLSVIFIVTYSYGWTQKDVILNPTSEKIGAVWAVSVYRDVVDPLKYKRSFPVWGGNIMGLSMIWVSKRQSFFTQDCLY